MAFIWSNFDFREQPSHTSHSEAELNEILNVAYLRMGRDQANQNAGNWVISTKLRSRKGNDGVGPKVMI